MWLYMVFSRRLGRRIYILYDEQMYAKIYKTNSRTNALDAS